MNRDELVGRICRVKGADGTCRIEARWFLTKQADRAYLLESNEGANKKRIVDFDRIVLL